MFNKLDLSVKKNLINRKSAQFLLPKPHTRVLNKAYFIRRKVWYKNKGWLLRPTATVKEKVERKIKHSKLTSYMRRGFKIEHMFEIIESPILGFFFMPNLGLLKNHFVSSQRYVEDKDADLEKRFNALVSAFPTAVPSGFTIKKSGFEQDLVGLSSKERGFIGFDIVSERMWKRVITKSANVIHRGDLRLFDMQSLLSMVNPATIVLYSNDLSTFVMFYQHILDTAQDSLFPMGIFHKGSLVMPENFYPHLIRFEESVKDVPFFAKKRVKNLMEIFIIIHIKFIQMLIHQLFFAYLVKSLNANI